MCMYTYKYMLLHKYNFIIPEITNCTILMMHVNLRMTTNGEKSKCQYVRIVLDVTDQELHVDTKNLQRLDGK